MKTTALITTEKKQEYPILVVDKLGIIGEKLAKELEQESLIIYVSSNPIDSPNIIHVPYNKKIPVIPDNTYSHIFIIDEYATISKEFINSFIKKAQHDNSSLILAININLTSENFVYNYVSSYAKSKIVITGDIFANDLIYDNETLINKFIQSARDSRIINVPDDGMWGTSPIYIDDVIIGILQAGFIEKEDDKIFFLYPQVKPTALTLAHMFQKNNPTLKIDFTKNLKYTKTKLNLNIEGKYLLEENYDLNSRIKKIEINNKNITQVERIIEKKEEVAPRKIKFSLLLVGASLVFIFFILLPLISTLVLASSGAYFLNSLKTNVQAQKLKEAKSSAQNAYNLLTLSKSPFFLLRREVNFIGQGEKLSFLSDKINQGIEVSSTASTILDSLDQIKDIAAGSNQNSDFEKLSDNLKNALVTYQKEKQSGNIPSSIDEKLNNLVSFASSTIDLWPDIIGFNGEKTYMILFENNMELRPGGGFIGSYGILTIDKAKVKSFKIYDVYDADGQLKGHVEPPFAIRRYFPSVDWFLRDSNFDVDFSKGAVASAVFLNSEMHQRVDGVIGVDLSFVKNLLSEIGPIEVSDYNKTITADNLFQTTQSQAQDNFFPGSTQKKDFLRSLYNSILSKLSQKKDLPYLNILKALTDSIYQKHIVFAFNNISLQSVFSINGWGSTLFDNRKDDDTTINDFTGINEANFSADKVNYYIGRSISQNVSINTSGVVSENLIVSIKNNADKSLKTNGVYKNYFRVILPQGATITKVQINDQTQKIVNAITNPVLYGAKNFIPPSGLEIDRQDEGGKTIYGFLTTLNPEDLKAINVSYTLLQKINLSKSDFSYDLKLFKQPGIDNFPYVFSLSLPKNLRALAIPKAFKKINGNIVLSKQVEKDEEFSLTLTK